MRAPGAVRDPLEVVTSSNARPSQNAALPPVKPISRRPTACIASPARGGLVSGWRFGRSHARGVRQPGDPNSSRRGIGPVISEPGPSVCVTRAIGAPSTRLPMRPLTGSMSCGLPGVPRALSTRPRSPDRMRTTPATMTTGTTRSHLTSRESCRTHATAELYLSWHPIPIRARRAAIDPRLSTNRSSRRDRHERFCFA